VFDQVTQRLDIRTKPNTITFPEREIVLAMSNAEAMAQIIKNSATKIKRDSNALSR